MICCQLPQMRDVERLHQAEQGSGSCHEALQPALQRFGSCLHPQRLRLWCRARAPPVALEASSAPMPSQAGTQVGSLAREMA